MSINLSSKNLELTPAIKSYVEEKVSAIHKINDNIQTVDVEVEKNQHQRKGEVFFVRINVQIPHALLRAEETQEDLYAAIDVCRDEIMRQLRKNKSKYESKKRKQQKERRSFKSILSFWK